MRTVVLSANGEAAQQMLLQSADTSAHAPAWQDTLTVDGMKRICIPLQKRVSTVVPDDCMAYKCPHPMNAVRWRGGYVAGSSKQQKGKQGSENAQAVQRSIVANFQQHVYATAAFVAVTQRETAAVAPSLLSGELSTTKRNWQSVYLKTI